MSIPTAAAVMGAKKKPVVANEDINGKPVQEIEYTFYGKIKSLQQLEAAKEIEEHEQWQVPLGNKGCGVKQRIREVNSIRWLLTTKTTVPGQLGVRECTGDITKEMFADMRQAGKNGYKKTRYVFPIFGSEKKWEIDVFVNGQGEKSLWVKIDLEVSGQADKIPDFPFELDDIIIHQEHEQTPEEARFIQGLWEEEWCRLDSANE